jgi:hypothetical protein
MKEKKLAEKWKTLVNACKSYYIDSTPTGMSDAEFDVLEKQALDEDGFSARDYVKLKYSVGKRVKNNYIERFKKKKVEGKMIDAMRDFEKHMGKKCYWNLKYDGSSIACYLDPSTGKVSYIATVGNLNRDNFGIDQTWKLGGFLPENLPLGVVAIQCEAVIDVSLMGGNPEKARQKANGLINSKYCEDEVNSMLTLMCYRYYLADGTKTGRDYKDLLYTGFPDKRSDSDGHLLFGHATTWTLQELEQMPGYTETEMTETPNGTFLNDGWVAYDMEGNCLGALKFAGAGSGDNAVITTVKGIQWNDQSVKGKDSWSANVIVDPIVLGGVTVRKPSAGSVSKLVEKNITAGAQVGIILANSTIPKVGDVYSPGDGNYSWPVCKCGYPLGSSDIYGSLLKCGNQLCTSRMERMNKYIGGLRDIHKDIDLGKLLVIDRFDWTTTTVDIDRLLSYVEVGDKNSYCDYLLSYMKTGLQKRNMNLVWEASFEVLKSFYNYGK